MKITLAQFVGNVQDRVTQADKILAKFQAGLTKDPVYALSWGGSAFEAAADRQIALEALGWLTYDPAAAGKPPIPATARLEAVKAEMTKAILQKAQYPASSTSATSNLMETQLTAARARFLDSLIWMGAHHLED